MELAGYTSRVGEMLDVFDDVSKGKYQRTSTNAAKQGVRFSDRILHENGQPVPTGSYFRKADL